MIRLTRLSQIIVPHLLEAPGLNLPLLFSDPLVCILKFAKVAPAIHVVFFLLFYSMWHCAATFMAEMTRYADRTHFYGKCVGSIAFSYLHCRPVLARDAAWQLLPPMVCACAHMAEAPLP